MISKKINKRNFHFLKVVVVVVYVVVDVVTANSVFVGVILVDVFTVLSRSFFLVPLDY